MCFLARTFFGFVFGFFFFLVLYCFSPPILLECAPLKPHWHCQPCVFQRFLGLVLLVSCSSLYHSGFLILFILLFCYSNKCKASHPVFWIHLLWKVMCKKYALPSIFWTYMMKITLGKMFLLRGFKQVKESLLVFMARIYGSFNSFHLICTVVCIFAKSSKWNMTGFCCFFFLFNKEQKWSKFKNEWNPSPISSVATWLFLAYFERSFSRSWHKIWQQFSESGVDK